MAPRAPASEPLRGRGIVVTRPHELAGALAAAIERAGGRAILFPAVEIEDLPAPPALRDLASFELAVFVSPTAVRKAMAHVERWPAGTRAAAIGAGTRRELERCGVRAVLAPAEAADSEALLALPDLQNIGGWRVVVVRGGAGRAVLGDTLAARGARVQYADCYRRVPPRRDPEPLLAQWRRGDVDAVAISSAEGFDNLLALLGTGGAGLLLATPLFVPHARVAAHARGRGARETIVAGAADDAMLERLVAYFHGRA